MLVFKEFHSVWTHIWNLVKTNNIKFKSNSFHVKMVAGMGKNGLTDAAELLITIHIPSKVFLCFMCRFWIAYC
jgi:hypothetical protein